MCIRDRDKELVGETLEMLQTCYQQLGKTDEWEVFLRRCVEENTGATAELMLAQILEQREGVEAAQNYVTPVSYTHLDVYKRQPSYEATCMILFNVLLPI